MPWNAALAGRHPSPDDVVAAQHITDDTKYRNWYNMELGHTAWPADVLLCQRQSMVWSRQDHRAYGGTILVTGYLLRRDGPRVPQRFYTLRRESSEANTRAGAEALRNEGREVDGDCSKIGVSGPTRRAEVRRDGHCE
jgi:hypothetical protein